MSMLQGRNCQGDTWQSAICTFFPLFFFYPSLYKPVLFVSLSPSSHSVVFLYLPSLQKFSSSSFNPLIPSHVFLSALPLGLIFFSVSFFVSKPFLPCHRSLSPFFCSRLVQCEQGLSMKIFNYTSRILDSPLFLFSPCISPALTHPLQTPTHPHLLLFQPSLSSTLFVSTCLHSANEWRQLQWKIEQTVHFTTWDC